jgi:hypothetical protein
VQSGAPVTGQLKVQPLAWLGLGLG